MALHFLSGDQSGIGKAAKKAAKKAEKKQAKQVKKATKKAEKATKPKGKVIKKIAKVGLAPSRAAFLAAVELNLLKLGTKLARVWNKPGGKEDLTKFWNSVSGDINHLKKAIAKGSKQSISGTSMGAVGAATVATATPLIVKVVEIIKRFFAGGDDAEQKEFDKGLNDGIKDLANDPDVQKGNQSMPKDADVAVVKPGGEGGEGSTEESSFLSPVGFCFKTIMILSIFPFHNSFLSGIASFILVYCLFGFLFVIPIIFFNPFGLKSFAYKYFSIPFEWFNSLIINSKRLLKLK